MERRWLSRNFIHNAPASREVDEYWAFLPEGYNGVKPLRDLRIMKRVREEHWIVRYGDFGSDAPEEHLPGTLSVEEAKAAAIALWRMK